MHPVWEKDIGNSRNHIRGNPKALGFVVPGDLVGNHSEERSQCTGLEADSWVGQLPNRMDMVAQVA